MWKTEARFGHCGGGVLGGVMGRSMCVFTVLYAYKSDCSVCTCFRGRTVWRSVCRQCRGGWLVGGPAQLDWAVGWPGRGEERRMFVRIQPLRGPCRCWQRTGNGAGVELIKQVLPAAALLTGLCRRPPPLCPYREEGGGGDGEREKERWAGERKREGERIRGRRER